MLEEKPKCRQVSDEAAHVAYDTIQAIIILARALINQWAYILIADKLVYQDPLIP